MAEFALAILPLVVEGCKLGVKCRHKLSSFRHYMESVEEIRVLFSVQVRNFLHECEQVLKHVLEKHQRVQASQLLDDFDHYLWTSSDLEESFHDYLGMSQEPFKNLVKLISKKVASLESDLSRFDEVDESGGEVCSFHVLLCLIHVAWQFSKGSILLFATFISFHFFSSSFSSVQLLTSGQIHTITGRQRNPPNLKSQ